MESTAFVVSSVESAGIVDSSVESSGIVVCSVESTGGWLIIIWKINSFSPMIGVLLSQYLYILLSFGQFLKTDNLSLTSVNYFPFQFLLKYNLIQMFH